MRVIDVHITRSTWPVTYSKFAVSVSRTPSSPAAASPAWSRSRRDAYSSRSNGLMRIPPRGRRRAVGMSSSGSRGDRGGDVTSTDTGAGAPVTLDPARAYPVLARADGFRVWDHHGNEYLDAIAGIAVANVG